MKKLGKILGFGLLGVFVLMLALVLAITYLLDPNDYKDDLRELARDKANIALTLNGPISWSFFPRLGLTLRDAGVASAATPETPLAHVQTLALSVRLLPLLRKNIQMSGIYVDGLNLTLVRGADGHGNWEGIGPPPSAEGPKSEAPENGTASPIAFNIDSVSITHGQASYDDIGQKKRFALTDLSLTTGTLGSGNGNDNALPLIFSGRFNGDGLDVKASLDTVLYFDFAAKHYRLENFKLSGEMNGQPFNGKALPFSAEGLLTADLALGTAEVPSLKLEVGEARAEISLKTSQLDQTPRYEGALTVAPFNPRGLLEAASSKLPPMADDQAFTKLALQTQFSGDADSVRLSDLRGALDETTVTGNASIDHFHQPRWYLTLKGDRLNVDRYLPPPPGEPVATSGEKKPPAAASPQPLWSTAPVLPLATLRTLALDAKVTFDALTIRQLTVDQVMLKANAQNGLLTLDTLQGVLLDGRLAAQGRLDARQDTPQLALQTKLNGIAVDKLLKSQSREPSPLQGKLTLDSHLTTSGNSQKAWIEHLSGNADFALTNGVLRDFNVEQQVCRAIALINRKTLTSEYGGKDTVFREFKGSLKLTNGVADNPDFKAGIPGLSASGRGQFDLRTLDIDYRLGVVIEGDQREMPDPACQINKNYAGIAWPVRCQGSLTQASTAKLCNVDSERLAGIAAQLAGNKLLDKLDKKLDDKLGDKAPANLRDALKGLLNR